MFRGLRAGETLEQPGGESAGRLVTRRRGLELALAAAASALFAVFLTWPQATNVTSLVASHHDTLFSLWRLSWVAHALQADPRHLFDANIFHPESGTLAYSDAMLLEGFVAAPLIWAGLSTVTAYNLLLLGGVAACGVSM